MTSWRRVLIVACVCLLCRSSSLLAAPRLAAIFGDRMVLQQDRVLKIWGRAEPGEKVSVGFAGQQHAGVADDNGRWSVTLEKLAANAKGRDLVVTGRDAKHVIHDVLVGDVWLCGGQSNMAWTLRSTVNRDLEIASADYTAIRFLRVPLISRGKPQADLPVPDPKASEGNWQKCVPDRVGNCTGVGYYFARRLYRMLKVPLGIVDVSWGGTMAQHWVAQEKLQPLKTMEPFIQRYEARLKQWKEWGGAEGARRAFQLAVKQWEKQRDEAVKKKKRVPGRPNAGLYQDPREQRHPAGMFNGMIHPIRSFRFRGILFYQGENNSFGESWKPFPSTFPLVISQWRESFGDLPFGIIQIAGWSNRRTMTYDMNHHTNIIREIQFDTWRATKNTGLIVTYDTNSNQSIHPAAKQPVGDRAARWALSEVYKVRAIGSRQPIRWKGPIVSSHEVQGEKIVVRFEEGGRRGLRLDKDDEIGFYIAGADRVFHHARARVTRKDGAEQLVVWSDKVKQPVAVRYAWSNLPVGRLMNQLELPAYPFRTDNWPLVPHQSTGEYHRPRPGK
ncbi:MAG: hypothetical protein QF363_18930 [Planctomycetaceae bacterium]|nr:hypothetical protein [Planctomycetaceae bacterium]